MTNESGESAGFMTAAIAPTQKTERINILDILRGYALFLILIGNFQTIRVPWFTPGYEIPPLSPIDDLARIIMYNTLGTELYLVFSFLFGLGFAVQISRAQAKGVKGNALFIRRMLGLFIVGCLHYLLIWDGDILRVYAVFGIVLLLLNMLSDRALWVGAVVLLVISPVATRLLYNVDFGIAYPDNVLEQINAVYYNQRSYLEVVAYRVNNFTPDFLAAVIFDGLNVLAMFMLGMYAGRRRIFENMAAYRPLFVWGLIIGIVGAIGGELLSIAIIHRPGMALIHVSWITLLAQLPQWNKRLSILIPFGQMSFTNYIMQSIIATTLFYGYGFGLSDEMGAMGSLLVSIGIGIAQIAFSYWWMSRFNFGPLEWVWRSLSYGKFQSMRKVPEDKPATAPV